MLNWDDLKFVLAVHRQGTMSAAANELRSNVATVSRRIDRLSADYGTPLFWKQNGRLVPTAAAEALVRLAADFESRLRREVNNSIATTAQGVAEITLAAQPQIISVYLTPRLGELLGGRDDLRLCLEDRYGNDALGSADLVIGLTMPESGRLITRRIGTIDFVPFRFDVPDPLDGWVCRTADQDHPEAREFTQGFFGRPPLVRVTSFDQKINVMRATGLSGILPAQAESLIPGLKRLGDTRDVVTLDAYLSFHETRRTDVALRAVVDWAIGAFSQKYN